MHRDPPPQPSFPDLSGTHPAPGPRGDGRWLVRTVWISDLHLGTPGCQAEALLDFLRRVDCETLYLVGDIIDGWQLRRSWYWPQAHNDVVQKLLRKVRKGTRVVFVPGNHDEFARRYVQHEFGGIEVLDEAVHRTADGRRLWVTHGDLFDGVVQCARWLACLGDNLYELTLRLNRHFNRLRARLGLPYWSLSRYLKLKVKRAVSYVSDFERAVAHEARKRGVDGVVCGHIHHAEIRDIDGLLYCNDGDWVESMTALVELVDGVRARGHEVHVIEPGAYRRFPCPGYREIEIAWRPGRGVARQLDALRPDAVHIATEGPMGAAARRHCLRRGWAFTTAFHTRFPEILAKGLRIPVRWSYAWFRRFHAPASAVMVPSDGMLGLLRGHGFTNARAWSHGVDLRLFQPAAALRPGEPPEPWRRPVFLYVGRLSYEKNLEAFLSLDLPGDKVVYGTGPLRDALMKAFPAVHWRGIVPRHELPAIYGSADVFVFPGRSETFGLVMLEAMACGTPVAAYPVPGPLDVVGDSAGGVLHEDLHTAALQALALPRQGARERALRFDWSAVCDQFLRMLVSVRSGPAAGMAPRCPPAGA